MFWNTPFLSVSIVKENKFLQEDWVRKEGTAGR